MKKLTYELTRVGNYGDMGESLVFHKKGSIDSVSSFLPVKNIKEGNIYEAEEDFAEHCEDQCRVYGLKFINNL